jgi:hypothetical protein
MLNTVNHVGGQTVTGLTATGTTQATALQLAGSNSLQEVTTVASGTGVILPVIRIGAEVTIVNQGANGLDVYPQPGCTINNGSVNASVSIAVGTAETFQASSLTNWYLVNTSAGSSGEGTGTVTSVVAGAGLAGGNITTSGTVSLAAIADKSVLGNTSGSAAIPVATTLSAMIDEALTASTQGDVLYRNATGWVALGPGTAGQVLQTGGAAANPSWVNQSGGGLSAIASDNLLANTTGSAAVPVATTLTALIDAAIGSTEGDVLYRGASSWNVLAPGTSGQVLTTGGASAVPSWTSVGGTGTVTSVTAGAGLSGGTITTTGTVALAAIADKSVLGNTSGSSAVPVATTLSAMIDEALSASTQGDVLYRGASGWVALAPGTSGQVLQTGGAAANPSWVNQSGGLSSIASMDLLANITGSAAVPVANTLTALIDGAIGSMQGDILYRGASTWSVLGPGTSGQFLETLGAAANPQWGTPSGSGSVNTGTAGQFSYYAAGGTAVSGTSKVLISTSGAANQPQTAAPGSPVDGDFWYDSTQVAHARYQNGQVGYLPRLLFSQITPGTASGTGAANLINTTSAIGSPNLQSGFFTPGKSIHIVAGGWLTTPSSPSNGSVYFTLGSTIIGGVTTITPIASASLTNSPFWLTADITCISSGSGGTFNITGFGRFATSFMEFANQTSAGATPTPQTPISLTTLAAYAVGVNITFGSGASSSCAQTQCQIWEVG